MAKVLPFPGRGARLATGPGARTASTRGSVVVPLWAPEADTRRRWLEEAPGPRPMTAGKSSGWLWNAINEQRIVVHYQPQYDMQTREMVAVEALVRIAGEDGQLQYPDTFIRDAEESGMILAIGRQVITRACEDLAAWRARGLELGSVAVNLSGSQLNLDDRLEPFIARALAAAGLRHADLQFEVTERQRLNPRGPGACTLRMLSRKGSALALDDFGAGYSSISFLSDHNVSTVKIDRAMIAKLLTDRMTQRIVNLLLETAAALEITVIAEGIESAEQHEFLVAAGCNRGQGYGFARPMAAEDLLQCFSG